MLHFKLEKKPNGQKRNDIDNWDSL